MKSVLISINPKMCGMIASGEATVIVQKTRPKLKTPFKCYIYETKGKSDVPTWMDEDGHVSYEIGGKVVGELVCDKVESRQFENGIAAYYSNEVGTCLSDVELRLYATAGKPLYFWHISELKIYDDPKELSEFKRYNRTCYFGDLGLAKPDCSKCTECNLTKPPQSWCYVEADGIPGLLERADP